MNPNGIGALVFACTLGGALAGMWLRDRLPGHHLSDDSKDTVKLGVGLIATMTALVLGLVTASAKNAFDVMDTTVKQAAADVLTFDRVLRALQARAVDLSETLLEARWAGLGGGGTSIPPLFFAVLLFWLTIIFASFGLFAPPNSTVLAVLVVCALSVAAAVFLIYEMDGAFEGLLAVSEDPMRFAYGHLDQ